ncbi:MAG: hypothetical protein V4648_02540 [Bacteroidota bacterium]
MTFPSLSNYQKTKYLAASYFIIIGLFNLADTLYNSREFAFRDGLILLVLSLPLLINKRLFYLSYGFLASLISLVILIAYIVTYLQSPIKTPESIWFFLLGCILFSAGLFASLALIYIGTYSNEKNRFTLL